jgi:hypothetical protein
LPDVGGTDETRGETDAAGGGNCWGRLAGSRPILGQPAPNRDRLSAPASARRIRDASATVESAMDTKAEAANKADTGEVVPARSDFHPLWQGRSRCGMVATGCGATPEQQAGTGSPDPLSARILDDVGTGRRPSSGRHAQAPGRAERGSRRDFVVVQMGSRVRHQRTAEHGVPIANACRQRSTPTEVHSSCRSSEATRPA